MNGTAEVTRLLRIAALLLSLATLADRASRAAPAVRFLVIVFLRPAESVMREFMSDGCALPALDDEGYDPASAMRLAERFVALAIALAGFANWLGACCGGHTGIAVCRSPMTNFPILDNRSEPVDTS